ncbi:MAG: M28 family peptidase [Saprospiraceae bacterium]|nr:M28 family peptidase [Saprospiraceae bacterium]
MKKLVFLTFLIFTSYLQASQLPMLTQCNVTLVNNTLEVSYELTDSDNQFLEVKCSIYYSKGTSTHTQVGITSLTGDIGNGVTPGPNKKVIITLANPTDLNSDLRVILSAFDNEPISIEEIVSKVNTNRMLSDLQFLQGKRNEITDKTFKDKSRLYIQEMLSPLTHFTSYESKVSTLTNINFEANIWGSDSLHLINIVDAHYDSFGQSPGADDNASGVAGVLEIGRVISEYSTRKSVRLVLFDLEESGLVGSNLYINNQLRNNDKLENVINFEMIGYYSEIDNTQDLPTGFNILFPEAYNEVLNNNRKGNFITNVGNTHSKNLLTAFQESAKNYVPGLKVISLEVPGNGTIVPDLRRSDHANFWDKGHKALMITDGANFRNKNYHTPKDSVQFLNMNFMTQVVKASLATICQLSEIQHGNTKSIEYKGSTLTKSLQSLDLAVFQTKDNLYISSTNNEEVCLLEIVDIQGHTRWIDKFTNQLTIDLNKLNIQGLCLIKLEQKKGKQIIKYIVTK